ncbi:ABC transporter ATP-binding protein [Pacificibacter marinus]|uniref:ABC transporter ATP-binding protein n=1 Tax=Pacificibacter marinus TaxID=658057 RepID=UPI001C06ADC1|nr:sn-glycerol-3-phosphate ABC transporter ATP-binding protein UgpC [Pacificibacter marinus]MBU2866567.1 sn-glycerol-3-phosphate ABC transporter ATP-binding protein UgpC [Pacificibacter marinus]
MSFLEITNIVKDYGAFRAINDVSFSVEEGEFIVMVGPSGCGKSTLLRSLAGLEDITSGSLILGGRDITRDEPADRGVAMVFQNYALYPHMTVAQNMGFGLKMAGQSKADVKVAVERAAKTLRITDHLHKRPKMLSGGQRQRVAIGRAITRSPDVFLFDEPLSNLDASLRAQMRVELGHLHAELGATMIYVTHDQVEAMTMASRIIVLNGGDIEQIGTPLELYNKPANRFVAEFLGSPRINLFDGKIAAINAQTASIKIDGIADHLEISLSSDSGPMASGDKVTVGIRPESINDTAPWKIPAKISVIESLGRETLFYVNADPVKTLDPDAKDPLFAVHKSNQITAQIGDDISLGIPQEGVFLFNEAGETVRYPITQTAP